MPKIRTLCLFSSSTWFSPNAFVEVCGEVRALVSHLSKSLGLKGAAKQFLVKVALNFRRCWLFIYLWNY